LGPGAAIQTAQPAAVPDRSGGPGVFKVFDSMKDGRARWTAHTAFEDPTPRRMRGREKASKSARWHFFRGAPPRVDGAKMRHP